MTTKEKRLELDKLREQNYKDFKLIFDKIVALKEFKTASELSTVYHKAKGLAYDAGILMMEDVHEFTNNLKKQ